MSHYFAVDDKGIVCAELSSSSDPGGGWIEAPHGQANLSGRTYNAETGLGPELSPKKADFEVELSKSLNEYSVWSNTLKVSIANSAPESSVTQLTTKVDSLWDYYLTVLAKWDAADS